ncbi:MAG: hypothetical protein ABSG68_20395 [Thermoguttaceae bacterium]|jgi:hypothetical protein
MIRCVCGSEVCAPALLKMSKLERAEPEPHAAGSDGPRPATGWGGRERLAAVGAVILALAGIGTLLVFESRPLAPTTGLTPDVVQQRVEGLLPAGALRAWHEDVLVRGLDPGNTPTDKNYIAARSQFLRWLGVVAVLGMVGAGLLAAGILNSRSRSGEIRD